VSGLVWEAAAAKTEAIAALRTMPSKDAGQTTKAIAAAFGWRCRHRCADCTTPARPQRATNNGSPGLLRKRAMLAFLERKPEELATGERQPTRPTTAREWCSTLPPRSKTAGIASSAASDGQRLVFAGGMHPEPSAHRLPGSRLPASCWKIRARENPRHEAYHG